MNRQLVGLVLSLLVISVATVNGQKGDSLFSGNYVVDLKNAAGNGYVEVLQPVSFSGPVTFELDFLLRSASSSQTLVEGTNSAAKTTFYIRVTNGGDLQFVSIGGTATAKISGFKTNTWYSIALVVSTSGATFYVNGNALTTNNNKVSITNSGEYKLKLGGNVDGLIDNFIIWNAARTVSQIKNFARSTPLEAAEQNKLILWFPFDEGHGDTAIAVTPVSSTSAWIRAKFVTASYSFAQTANYMRCYSWGDPHMHVYNWDTVSTSDEWAKGKEVSGTRVFTGCSNHVEMRTYSNLQPEWKWTVQRVATIRVYDRFYMAKVADEFGVKRGFYYKDSPTGNWVALSGSSGTDANGVTWKISGSTMTVAMPFVGYVTLELGSKYINIDSYWRSDLCVKENRPKGLCDRFVSDPMNIFFEDWKYGPDPADPVPPAPEQPCQGNPGLLALAQEVCSAFGDSNSEPFKGCVFDVCVSGEPDLTTDTPPSRACLIQDFMNAASGKPGPSTCPACPNSCSGHGVCKTNANGPYCECNQGWVGPDCGSPRTWDCYDLTSTTNQNKDRHLTPLNVLIKDSPASVVAKYAVEDSVIVIPLAKRTQVTDILPNQRLLAFVADHTSSTDGGSYTATLEFVGSPDLSQLELESGMTLSGNKLTFSRSWSAYKSSVVIIGGLPEAYTVNVKITSATNINQVLVGSGTLLNELDVLKISEDEWSTGTSTSGYFTITAEKCEADPCDKKVDTQMAGFALCQVCTADPKCGYCVDTGRCVRGDRAGPLRGTCRNWRYSFDEKVSRRVTSNFGWPVNPVDTEVYLSTFDTKDLPIDIRVNSGDRHDVFDILVMLEANVDDDLIRIISGLRNLLTTLQDTKKFPNVQLGFARYGNSVNLVQNLGGVSSNNVWQYQRALESFTGSNTEATNKQLNAISLLAGGQGYTPNWRKNARKLLIIQTAHDYNHGDATTLQKARGALLDKGIIPVFAVSNKINPNLVNIYKKDLVDNFNPVTGFGFGLVLPLAADSSNLDQVIIKATRLTTGQISIVPKPNTAGHINIPDITERKGNVYSIHGLNTNHRARFSIPVKRMAAEKRVATLYAVGFGEAKIEDIDSDKPTCTDRTITGPEDTDIIFALTGSSFRNLMEVIPRIRSLPSKGTLFMVKSDGTLEQITSVDIPIVGKLAYRALPNDHSDYISGKWSTYTSFKYSAFDGCADSDEKTVNIIVTPENDPPVANPTTASLDEDTEADITLTFSDPDVKPADTLTVQFSTLPNYGTLIYNNAVVSGNTKINVGTARSLVVKYKPFHNYNGKDFFSFYVVDAGNARSSSANVDITVIPVNDPPRATVANPVAGAEDQWNPITLMVDDIDKDGLQIKFDWDYLNGTLCLVNATGLGASDDCPEDKIIEKGEWYPETFSPSPLVMRVWFRGDPNLFTCTDQHLSTFDCPVTSTFKFQGRDNGSPALTSNVATVQVYIFDVNDPPVVKDLEAPYTNEDKMIIVDLKPQVYDVEDPELKNITIHIVFPTKTSEDDDGLYKGATLLDPEDNFRVVDRDNSVLKGFQLAMDPNPNAFGDPNNDWYYLTVAFKAFDRHTYSDVADVVFRVKAINDPPTATLDKVSVLEDHHVAFALTAFDIDNDEEDLTYYITELPDPAHGKLYMYNEQGVYTTEVKAKDEIKRSADGRPMVVFKPNTDWYGKTTFRYKVVDKDTYNTSKVEEDERTTEIEVLPVNDAPYAYISPVEVDEDSQVVITLEGSDDWYGEKDPFVAIITKNLAAYQGCGSKVGKLYQYDDSKANKRGEEIIGDNVQVTDPQRRIVYVPDPNMNSDDSLAVYTFVKPYFEFKVIETQSQAEPRLLESNTVFVSIFIRPRNDAPEVYNHNDVNWRVNDSICAHECEFDEDLGKHYKVETGTVPLWLGGDDIEKTALTFVVVDMDCPSTAFVRAVANNEVITPNKLPYTIPAPNGNEYVPEDPLDCEVAPSRPALRNLLSFAPGRDEFNVGSYYCRVTYKVVDSNGAESKTKDITVYVNPVNDRPRTKAESVYGLEDLALDFVITGVDVENDEFDLVLDKCEHNEKRGKFFYKAGDEFVEFKCGQGSFVVERKFAVKEYTEDGQRVAVWAMRFIPEPNENGLAYNYIFFHFDDGKSVFDVALDTYNIEVNILPRNDAPEITLLAGEQVSTAGSEVSIAFAVSDPDFEFDYPVRVTVIADRATIVEESGKPGAGFEWSRELPIDEMNKVTSKLVVRRVAGASSEAYSTKVKIVVSDLGNIGMCANSNDEEPKICPLEAEAEITVHFGVEPADYTVVGASAGAAGIAAILAGAIAYRWLRKKPDDDYQPWEIDDNDMTTTTNPLYEASGNCGENPLYEAKTSN